MGKGGSAKLMQNLMSIKFKVRVKCNYLLKKKKYDITRPHLMTNY